MHALVAAARRRRETGDGGFTLLEVMVAIILLGIVAAGVVPLLVGTLKAANAAKLNTQAKNLAQAQVERMRNLPYHVAQSAGPYIDLLDIYFHDLGNGNDTKCGTGAGSYSAGTLPASTRPDSRSPVTRSRCQPVPGQGPQLVTHRRDTTANRPPGWTSRRQTPRDDRDRYLEQSGGATKSYSTSPRSPMRRRTSADGCQGARRLAVALAPPWRQRVAEPAEVGRRVVNADTSLSTGATANAQVQGRADLVLVRLLSTSQASGSLIAPSDQTPSRRLTDRRGTAGVRGRLCDLFRQHAGQQLTGKASNGLPLFARPLPGDRT